MPEEYKKRGLPLVWDDYKQIILNHEDALFHPPEPAQLMPMKVEKVPWTELGRSWAMREIRMIFNP